MSTNFCGKMLKIRHFISFFPVYVFFLTTLYKSTNVEYVRTSDAVFFEQVGFAFDVYSKYDKFPLAGDSTIRWSTSGMDGIGGSGTP